MFALPVLPVALPLTAAALLLIGNRKFTRRLAEGLAILATVAAMASSLALIFLSYSAPIVYWAGGWRPIGNAAIGISLFIDPTGAALSAFTCFLGILSFVFSLRYFEAVGTIYHVLMLCFIAGMSGFTLSGDLFNIFVFFELMSVSAFSLCGYKSEEISPIQGAVNFAVTNTIGSYLIITGIALVYARTGALNLSQIAVSLGGKSDSLIITAFAFLVCGFLIKAAIAPFHFWLADAHAVAPTPVCVLFSGVMAELGVYVVARIYWVSFQPSFSAHESELRAIFVAFGAITAVLAALLSFAQLQLKRMLAYSTISHTGLILLGFALLSPRAWAGSLLYLLGHGAVKAALFCGAGILLHRLGTIEEDELHARGREIPGTFLTIAFVALGLSGVPPFGTFTGESMIDDAARSAHYEWISYVFIFAGALTAAAVLRAIGGIFLGWGPSSSSYRSREPQEKRETKGGEQTVPSTMYIPIAILLLLGFSIGFIPELRAVCEHTAMQFQDQSGNVARVLYSAHLPLHEPPPQASLMGPILRGLFTTVLAIVIALISLFHKQVAWLERLQLARLFGAPMVPLRALHTGKVGDYVAWLTFGIGLFGGLFALFLR
jgi:multicomponent Na+:H+ antiporter subunit D